MNAIECVNVSEYKCGDVEKKRRKQALESCTLVKWSGQTLSSRSCKLGRQVRESGDAKRNESQQNRESRMKVVRKREIDIENVSGADGALVDS